jgi:hypothetical protein
MVIKLIYLIKRKLRAWFIRWSEFPLVEIEKYLPAQVGCRKSVIPNVVYQTWVTNKFGKTHAKEIRNFRDINPDTEFHLYDESDLNDYMYRYYKSHPIYKVFKNSKFGPMRADIFRYCILYERGGYYFDIKGCLTEPIAQLCPGDIDGYISYENCDCSLPPDDDHLPRLQYPTKYVVQWGMGFVSGHIILKRMIDSICDTYPFYKGKVFENPKLAILSYTGTGKFTKIVRDEIGKNSNINVLQSGVDFDGYGVYSMKGADVRYLSVPAYTNFHSMEIVS